MAEQRRNKVWRRLTLRDGDGRVFLDRWGMGIRSVGTVYLHRMEAPDPGVDLHDHPWWFVTIPLWGGYVERRADRYLAGVEHVETRRPLRPRVMGLRACHTIDRLRRRISWSLVITGPVRREWGFFTAGGWVQHNEYENTPSGAARAATWTSNYKGDGASWWARKVSESAVPTQTGAALSDVPQSGPHAFGDMAESTT